AKPRAPAPKPPSPRTAQPRQATASLDRILRNLSASRVGRIRYRSVTARWVRQMVAQHDRIRAIGWPVASMESSKGTGNVLRVVAVVAFLSSLVAAGAGAQTCNPPSLSEPTETG